MTWLRRLTSGVLLFLACIGILGSSLAIWAKRTALDSDHFAQIVREALRNPDVKNTLADYVSKQTMQLLGVKEGLEGWLPPEYEVIAPVLTGALQGLVTNEVNKVLERDTTQDALVQIVKTAHQEVVALLEGDGISKNGLSIAEGEVRLNLVPIVVVTLTELQKSGFVDKSIDFGRINEQASGDEQVAQLSNVLGFDIPDSLGQVVVYESSSVASGERSIADAQRALALFQRAYWMIIVTSVILAGAAVLIAVNRRQAITYLGVGVAMAMAASLVAVSQVAKAVPKLFTDPDVAVTAKSLTSSLTNGLIRLNWTLLTIALIIAFSTWAQDALGHFLRAYPRLARISSVFASIALLWIFGIGWLSLLMICVLTATVYFWTHPQPIEY